MKALDLFCGLTPLNPILEEWQSPAQSSHDGLGIKSTLFSGLYFPSFSMRHFLEPNDEYLTLSFLHKPCIVEEFEGISERTDPDGYLYSFVFYYTVFGLRDVLDEISCEILLQIYEHTLVNSVVYYSDDLLPKTLSHIVYSSEVNSLDFSLSYDSVENMLQNKIFAYHYMFERLFDNLCKFLLLLFYVKACMNKDSLNYLCFLR